MASTSLVFQDQAQHRAWIESQALLPAGFRVGLTSLSFLPREAPKPAKMNLTVIALDQPSPDFAAMFTRNAFPGAPVIVGRRRLTEASLGAIVINNKISNVCAPDGESASETVSAAAGSLLSLAPTQVLPCSTGVIGWQLPVDAMIAALPAAVAGLEHSAAAGAKLASGIMTTDLYPKARRAAVGAGSIMGVAKGAGMVEPNMATMLVYVLTDLAIPRDRLREILPRVVNATFNHISIDSDTSTSDTIALISSGLVPCPDEAAFEAALHQVCADLAEDVVRNGEGVRHVIKVHVSGAPDATIARAVGKSIVNAPLFKCAIAGNDPNVGRLIQAIGKLPAAADGRLPVDRLVAHIGETKIFGDGVFHLDPRKEETLTAYLTAAELYVSKPEADGSYAPPVTYPPHERAVEITLDFQSGPGTATVTGADLTHEYVSENADYRS